MPILCGRSGYFCGIPLWFLRGNFFYYKPSKINVLLCTQCDLPRNFESRAWFRLEEKLVIACGGGGGGGCCFLPAKSAVCALGLELPPPLFQYWLWVEGGGGGCCSFGTALPWLMTIPAWEEEVSWPKWWKCWWGGLNLKETSEKRFLLASSLMRGRDGPRQTPSKTEDETEIPNRSLLFTPMLVLLWSIQMYCALQNSEVRGWSQNFATQRTNRKMSI